MTYDFTNILGGINIKDECFVFLKDKLIEEYNFELFIDLLSLPCMQFRENDKLNLIFSLLENSKINDTIIDILCSLLENISEDAWDDKHEVLSSLIVSNPILLSRNQRLHLAHTIEVMYAKEYKYTFNLAKLIYQGISVSNQEFNADSEENVRISLAKIAYGTSKYNFNERIRYIKGIKHHLEISHRKYLFGIVHYYIGLCMKAIGISSDDKNDIHYMLKSQQRGFPLATIYLEYRAYYLETSNEG